MLIILLLVDALAMIPDNCKWTDAEGYHYDLNPLKKANNYQITSQSGALMFEFNFCTWGVKCLQREVAAFQIFHHKCYTLGLKDESTIYYDDGLQLTYKKGDLCGESSEYQITFDIKCGDEAFHQIITNSPCNILIQGKHKVACRQSNNHYVIYAIIIALIFAGVYYLWKKERVKAQGYIFV